MLRRETDLSLDLELVMFHLALYLIFCKGGLAIGQRKEREETKANDQAPR